jgi:putative endonuclease
MPEGAYLNIAKCRDGSYYAGTTRVSLEIRTSQHHAGAFPGYTSSRRPVELVFSQWFDHITNAIEAGRKLKGWSRAKKEAFTLGDSALLQQLAKRKKLML